MKYLITESQIDNVIFKYLDNQDFIVTGDDTSLFFINSESDELAQIRYDEDSGVCFINIDLNKEISSFFNLRRDDSQKVICRWVENTLQMEVTKTPDAYRNIDDLLRVPTN